MKNTIFVTIASFLDYEIYHTILDCIFKAKHPENLNFAVVLQYDENNGTNEYCIDSLKKFCSIQIEKHHYTNSEGGCWARQKCQMYYSNEDYVLQIDSHTRFIQNWDEILISNISNLKKVSDKPIISFMPPSYSRYDDIGIDYYFTHLSNLDKINIPKVKYISTEHWVDYIGYENEKLTNYKNIKIPLLYGCFIFAEGKWVLEIEQDPEHYYTGEELALAIRSYTHGYDIFTPTQIVSWHRAHPNGNKKHFNTFPQEVSKNKHIHAVGRLKKLLNKEDLGKYGLGNIRTIEEYMEFSGLNFFTREITPKDNYV